MTPVYKFSASSIKGRTNYGSMLAGNTAYVPPSWFESIATVTVGSGGAANVEFTSIPGTYSHLQIRGISRSNKTNDIVSIYIRVNNDSGSNYAWHQLYGDGSTVGSSGSASQTYAVMPQTSSDYRSTSVFGATIIDILDYANTNKYKTLRGFGGYDANTQTGMFLMRSGLWMSTSAITSIKITADAGTDNWNQYTTFALYGIKSA
jgi:hypothetical protein